MTPSAYAWRYFLVAGESLVSYSCCATRSPAEGAQERVGLDLALAEHLRQPPGGHVAADVHLVEPVLRLDVALRHEQVLVGVSA